MKRQAFKVLIVVAVSLPFLCGCNQGGEKVRNTSEELYTLKDNVWLTERLRVEPVRTEDWDSLAPMVLDDDVTKYLMETPTSIRSLSVARDFLIRVFENNWKCFVIKNKDDGKRMGIVSYNFNRRRDSMYVAYFLGKEFWKQGYAREAAVRLSNYLFENSEKKVFEIEFNIENTASAKLADLIADNMISNHEDWSKEIENQNIKFEIISKDASKVKLLLSRFAEGSSIANSSGNVYLQRDWFPENYLSGEKKFETHNRFIKICKTK